MNPGDIAPMIVMVTGILTAGGVILFWPLSRRIGELLHAMAQERLSPPGYGDRDTARLADALQRIDSRLSLLEDRQGFTESLLDRQSARVGTRVPLPRAAGAAIGAGDDEI
jgi:hypothetical protein